MVRRFSVNFVIFSILLDGLVVSLALLAATYLRPNLAFLPFAAHYPTLIPTPISLYPVFALEWVAINLLFDVYNVKRARNPVDDFVRLSLAALLAGVALAGTLYLSFRQVSRLLFISFVVLSYFQMLGWRTLFDLLRTSSQKSARAPRRILIVGAGSLGRELQSQISQQPEAGLEVAGLLDDDLKKQERNQDILGSIDDALTIIQNHQIDDIVISLPQSAYLRINQLVTELLPLPVKVWVIPDYFRLALHQASFDSFAGIPLLDLRAPALNNYQRLIKRSFDLVLASLSLLVCLPWMGVIALLIRLESSGPVVLQQQRVGENGHLFRMLKFRSMVHNAEELRSQVETLDQAGNLIHKTKQDPRVTRIGRLLRRTSLDELPQLFNVLKGEMSLVGPRPELPYLVEKYEPWQRARFSVPQGITGWWQIQGRSDKPMHLNTEDDLFYVQNYSILLDIYILLKTITVVWSGKGAY